MSIFAPAYVHHKVSLMESSPKSEFQRWTSGVKLQCIPITAPLLSLNPEYSNFTHSFVISAVNVHLPLVSSAGTSVTLPAPDLFNHETFCSFRIPEGFTTEPCFVWEIPTTTVRDYKNHNSANQSHWKPALCSTLHLSVTCLDILIRPTAVGSLCCISVRAFFVPHMFSTSPINVSVDPVNYEDLYLTGIVDFMIYPAASVALFSIKRTCLLRLWQSLRSFCCVFFMLWDGTLPSICSPFFAATLQQRL